MLCSSGLLDPFARLAASTMSFPVYLTYCWPHFCSRFLRNRPVRHGEEPVDLTGTDAAHGRVEAITLMQPRLVRIVDRGLNSAPKIFRKEDNFPIARSSNAVPFRWFPFGEVEAATSPSRARRRTIRAGVSLRLRVGIRALAQMTVSCPAKAGHPVRRGLSAQS